MYIVRNEIDKEILRQLILLNDGNINLFLTELDNKNYLVIRGLEKLSFQNFCMAVSMEYPVDKQLYYLDMFIEASMAKYQMATNTGKMIAIDFAGNIYKFVPEEKDYTVSEQNWIRGFMAALARRKMKTVHAFCAINLDIVNQKKKTKGGEYSVLFASLFAKAF